MKNSVLIHIPHASTKIPKEYLSSYKLEKLDHKINVMTDWYCDEIFDCGRKMLITNVSRLVCDVERFRNDEKEIMAKVGMGAIYTSCSDCSILRNISEGQKETILKNIMILTIVYLIKWLRINLRFTGNV